MTTLHEIVRLWRDTAGLTQAAAAARIGVSQPTFSRTESGARIPDPATARRFVDVGVFTAEQFGRAALAPIEQRAA